MAGKRSKKQNNCNGKDYISNLPDDILFIILSELKLTEAARTSILSSRWRNLWTFLSGTLDIDASDCMSQHKLMDSKQRLGRNSMFFDTVDQILRQHQGPAIDKLRISSPNRCYIDDCRLSKFLDSWIDIAIQKQAKHLELYLKGTMIFPVPSSKKRIFPAHLRLLGSTSFVHLVSLHLEYVQISAELIHCFLSNSPLLEELLIVNTLGFLECVRICGPSLKLKRLDLISNPIEVLEISAPNLVTFNYQNMGRRTDLLLKDIPLLAQLSYGDERMADIQYDYPILVPRLESLTLTLPQHWLMSHSIPHFPALKNLKQVQLLLGCDMEAGLLLLFRLMEASPSLHRLSLNLGQYECPTPDPECTNECPKYQSLKVVEIVNFTWSENEIELVKCIAQYALSIEKIIIYSYIENNDPESIRRVVRELKSSVPQRELEIH